MVSGKKVQTRVLAMDFSKVDDAAQWSAFQAEVENLDVGVLGKQGRHGYIFASLTLSSKQCRQVSLVPS
jgi:hypothetical protein